MKFVTNARFLTQPITGVQRYAIELSKRLKAAEPNIRFLTPKDILHHDLAEILEAEVCGRLTGHPWEQFELPFFTRGRPLLSLCNTSPITKHQQIITIHDAAVFAVPESFSFAFRAWYHKLLPRLAKVAKKIVTGSEFSKRELVHYCNIPAGKIEVVYLGSDHVLEHSAGREILEKHGLTRRPFAFAVSSRDPRKNFTALAEAVADIERRDFDVVVAGGTNPSIFQTTGALPSNIKYLGYVSDAELRALYDEAACYVFPSLYEGFGLTPLEAMTCGCPVIVSNAASLPEVCGDAALYCDPHSPQDIADKIQRLMSDSELRETLRQKGLERAKQFSWDKCARETLAVIQQALVS